MTARPRLAASLAALALALAACSNADDRAERRRDTAESNAPAQEAALPDTQANQTRFTGPAQPLPAGALQLNITEIRDPANMLGLPVAARVLVPAGWRTEGGVVWGRHPTCEPMSTYSWRAIAPDNVTQVELIPSTIWQTMSTAGGCQVAPLRNAQDYLAAVIQSRWPGARITGYTPRPEFIQTISEYTTALVAYRNQLSQQMGLPMHTGFDAGEMRYTHMENGVEVEGVIYTSAFIHSFGSAFAAIGVYNETSYVGSSIGAFSVRAPKGQLDTRLAETIRKSVKPDPMFTARLMDAEVQRGWVQTDAVARQAAIIVAGGEAMTRATIARNQAAVQAGIERSRSASAAYADFSSSSSGATAGGTDDRSQRERIESLRGVETYDDPLYGGTVQLDNTYDHAWRVQNSDSYILTNDPNFNPGQFNIDARQLQVAR